MVTRSSLEASEEHLNGAESDASSSSTTPPSSKRRDKGKHGRAATATLPVSAVTLTPLSFGHGLAWPQLAKLGPQKLAGEGLAQPTLLETQLICVYAGHTSPNAYPKLG